MAQALLEEIAWKEGIDLEVKSAGIYASDGQNASMGAVEALGAEGIDIGAHRASTVNEKLLKWADLILTMGKSHKKALLSRYDTIENKIYTLKEYAYGIEGDIADPFGGDINIYNDTKEEIKNALMHIIKVI